jgi:hypothetical protein
VVDSAQVAVAILVAAARRGIGDGKAKFSPHTQTAYTP